MASNFISFLTILSALGILLLSALGGVAYSADLASKEEALSVIADFSKKICKSPPPLNGSKSDLELSGTAKAALNDVITKMVDLGIEGAAKYKASKDQSVLQKDLANLLQDGEECRIEIFRELKDTLLKETYSTRQSTGIDQLDIMVDLDEAKLNEHPFYDLTKDDLTSTLGQPSSAQKYSVVTVVHYQNLGLSFTIDDKDKIVALIIHFSKESEKNSGYYKGNTSKGINGDSSYDIVLEKFADFKPLLITPEEKKEFILKTWNETTTKSTISYILYILDSILFNVTSRMIDQSVRDSKGYSVFVKLDKHSIRFDHYEDSKFIKTISLVCLKKISASCHGDDPIEYARD